MTFLWAFCLLTKDICIMNLFSEKIYVSFQKIKDNEFICERFVSRLNRAERSTDYSLLGHSVQGLIAVRDFFYVQGGLKNYFRSEASLSPKTSLTPSVGHSFSMDPHPQFLWTKVIYSRFQNKHFHSRIVQQKNYQILTLKMTSS